MTRKDDQEACIQKMIASDPEAPEATNAQLAEARPFADAFPHLAEAMRRNAGGRPRAAVTKTPVSLRLDAEVLARLKSQGPGWQTRVNDILKTAVGL